MNIIHTHNFIEIDKKIEYILKETIAYFRRQVRMTDKILQIKTNLQRYFSPSESKTNSTYQKGNTISGKYKNEKRINEANYNKIRKILGWKKLAYVGIEISQRFSSQVTAIIIDDDKGVIIYG